MRNTPHGHGVHPIRRERERRGWSQAEVAKRIGAPSPNHVSRWERGAVTPSPYYRERFCQLFEKNAEELGFVVRRAPERPRPPERGAGVPPNTSPHFLGREAELAELRRKIDEYGRVAVHGLGGVGKTQLAAHYIHRRRDDYGDGVFWLRAEEEALLLGDLAALAPRLGLPEREAREQERQVAAVLRWLAERRRWLVVLDNVEPAATEAIWRWLPADLPGHVLLTSRMPECAARLRVEALPAEVATHFLLRRTDQADERAAAAIADALGCLPLALEQAAAYIEATGRDLASYAGLLRTRLVHLMDEGRPANHPQPVASTWQLSFDLLEAECPEAAALLRLCAFLAPDDIPVSVLAAAAHELPDPLCWALGDDVQFDRAVAALRRYSLIERQADGLRVHRLVQAVLRESLDDDGRATWMAAASRLLRSGFPKDAVGHPERWPLCARLLPHATFVVQLAAGGGGELDALGDLLGRAGQYLYVRVEFEPALAAFERSLAIREAHSGPDHPDTADSLTNLGNLLRRLGRHGPARAALERAMAIRERALGPEHPLTAESLDNLGGLLLDLGDFPAARALRERALAITERTMGSEHPETATCLNNLAMLLREEGDLPAARALSVRALAIRERVLGPDHIMTATCLANLSSMLHELGELAAARPLAERALAIRERVLGPDDPALATSLANLAALLRAQGEPALARPLIGRALGMQKRRLGPDHQSYARSLYTLGLVLRDEGNLAAARGHLERALATTLERVLGTGHGRCVAVRRTLEEIADANPGVG